MAVYIWTSDARLFIPVTNTQCFCTYRWTLSGHSCNSIAFIHIDTVIGLLYYLSIYLPTHTYCFFLYIDSWPRERKGGSVAHTNPTCGHEPLIYLPTTMHTVCTITGPSHTAMHIAFRSMFTRMSGISIARSVVYVPGNLPHARSTRVCDMNTHSRAYLPSPSYPALPRHHLPRTRPYSPRFLLL